MSRPSFRKRLTQMAASSLPAGWRRLLRLDRPAAHVLGAPPPPSRFERGDVASERLEWRGLLERHSRPFAEAQSGEIAAPGMRSVERMLALLIEMQDHEDAVVSRHLADTRG